tara:strand:- start:254 stop:487 length:234 start_codon:yes stop_codon:yes gene_type:complete
MALKSLSFKKTKTYSFDVESPIKKLSKSLNNKNMKYILSIIVLLFVAGGIATLIFLLINNTNDDNNDTNDINEVNEI